METFWAECQKVRDFYRSTYNVSFSMDAGGYFGSFVRGDGTMGSPPTDICSSSKGKGRECLLKLCEIADRHKINLYLYATREKCVQLYLDCGFIIKYENKRYRCWDMKRPYK